MNSSKFHNLRFAFGLRKENSAPFRNLFKSLIKFNKEVFIAEILNS